MVAQVENSVAGQSGGQVTSCAVCTVHVEMMTVGFLVKPQNQGQQFVSGLAPKPLGRSLSGLASKPTGRFLPVWPQNWWQRFLLVWSQYQWLRISQVGPQNRQLRFGDLVFKITAIVSWFGPQNQAGFGLSVAPPNRWEDEDNARYVSRSSGLLRVEASQSRVSQSSLKTAGGAAWMVHVASS
jgi:hypothetical protein